MSNLNPFAKSPESSAIVVTEPNVSAFAGATGGPGQAPSLESHVHPDSHSSYTDPFKEALERELRNNDREIMEVMIGGSGGIGGIPTSVDEALTKEVTPVMAMHLLYESVSKMSMDEKYNKFVDVHNKTQFNITKAQKFIATVGLQLGIIVNLIKKDVIMNNFGKKAWVDYRREKFDKHIHPNTLAVYMKVAQINNVASYLHLGIDRLGKLAGVIEKRGMIHDEDPIKDIIDAIDNQTMATGVAHDFTEKCEAAILHYRIKKAGLDEITMNDILSVLAEGRSIDKKDIDKMIEMKNGGVDYRQYIDKDSEYNNPITIEAISESNKPKIRDVNAEITKLSETVSKALTIPPSKINLDLEKLDALINTLAALRQNFAASKETLKQ
ncbi:MAG: hypothetical protein EOL98_09455 [Negativicutes bacterium]|nr:hypothetical protein [Negativicutes bacterium]